jgi:hypothetical protein
VKGCGKEFAVCREYKVLNRATKLVQSAKKAAARSVENVNPVIIRSIPSASGDDLTIGRQRYGTDLTIISVADWDSQSVNKSWLARAMLGQLP